MQSALIGNVANNEIFLNDFLQSYFLQALPNFICPLDHL